jgi:hypothetical protein
MQLCDSFVRALWHASSPISLMGNGTSSNHRAASR